MTGNPPSVNDKRREIVSPTLGACPSGGQWLIP